jgi:hypothetical protein
MKSKKKKATHPKVSKLSAKRATKNAAVAKDRRRALEDFNQIAARTRRAIENK